MRKSIILLVLMLGWLATEAQHSKLKRKPVSFQKHYNEVLPKAPQYKMSGWFFAPGATYMLTRFVPRNETLNETASTKLEGKFTPLGKPGVYAEVGRYQMLQYWKLFKYMDYGISYKMLRGREKAEGTLMTVPSEAVLASEGPIIGKFAYHYAEAFINLNHIWRISKYNFVQNSIGANAGYAFIRSMGGGTITGATVSDPGRFSAQLHYKLGFGIKMRGNWLLIPAVETPILNLLPFEPTKSAYGFFTSRYRPLMFSLRFFFMRPANTLDCTPVRTREGVKMPTDMDKQNQMQEEAK